MSSSRRLPLSWASQIWPSKGLSKAVVGVDVVIVVAPIGAVELEAATFKRSYRFGSGFCQAPIDFFNLLSAELGSRDSHRRRLS